MTEILGFGFEDVVEKIECFRRSSHAAKHQRKVRLGGRPTRSQLDRPPQKIFGVAPASDPRSKLREHADRADIERVFLQVRLENSLGDVEAILIERHRCLDEPRMPAGSGRILGRHVGSVAPSASRRYAPFA